VEWGRHVAYMEETKSAYKLLVRKPLWRPKHRWEDNTKMDLEEIDCEDVTGIPGSG
jgi:hypothetical protein